MATTISVQHYSDDSTRPPKYTLTFQLDTARVNVAVFELVAVRLFKGEEVRIVRGNVAVVVIVVEREATTCEGIVIAELRRKGNKIVDDQTSRALCVVDGPVGVAGAGYRGTVIVLLIAILVRVG